MLPAIFPCTNNRCFLISTRSQRHSDEDHESIITRTIYGRGGGRHNKIGMAGLQVLLHPQAA